jgi:cephalosporin hydroxylase
MITIIDNEAGQVVVTDRHGERRYPLSSPEAFVAVSHAWLRAGWDVKHVYSFSWMGRPIIQLPEDMVRMQELIWKLKPDVLIETGIAHGGSLIFYASLFEAMHRGRVVGVDIEIRPNNRAAIESHPLYERIELIEGSSIDPGVFERVRKTIVPGESVLVVLDSNHSRDHVLAELRAYSSLVPVGGYIVATDGIMESVVGAPRSQPDWAWNNPRQAIREFVAENPHFAVEEPTWSFNEGSVNQRVTYWPDAFLRRAG